MQSSDINVTNIKVRQTLTKQNQTSRYKEGGKKRDPGKEEVKYPKRARGEQATGNGARERGTGNGKREKGKREKGKRKREKGKGKRRTGNGK